MTFDNEGLTATSNMINVKALFNYEFRRFAVPTSSPLAVVEARVRALFSIAPQAAVELLYRDSDGDLITLTLDAELQLAYKCSSGLLRLVMRIKEGDATVATPKIVAPAIEPEQKPAPQIQEGIQALVRTERKHGRCARAKANAGGEGKPAKLPVDPKEVDNVAEKIKAMGLDFPRSKVERLMTRLNGNQDLVVAVLAKKSERLARRAPKVCGKVREERKSMRCGQGKPQKTAPDAKEVDALVERFQAMGIEMPRRRAERFMTRFGANPQIAEIMAKKAAWFARKAAKGCGEPAVPASPAKDAPTADAQIDSLVAKAQALGIEDPRRKVERLLVKSGGNADTVIEVLTKRAQCRAARAARSAPESGAESDPKTGGRRGFKHCGKRENRASGDDEASTKCGGKRAARQVETLDPAREAQIAAIIEDLKPLGIEATARQVQRIAARFGGDFGQVVQFLQAKKARSANGSGCKGRGRGRAPEAI